MLATLLLAISGLLLILVLGALGLESLREGEPRAARVATLAAVAISAPLFLLLTLLPAAAEWVALGVVALAVLVTGIAFFVPHGREESGADVPQARVDERDIMFARARLEPGTANHERYYQLRPENKSGDDKTRRLPGLLSPKASAYHPLVFPATEASFDLTESVRDAVDGPIASQRTDLDPVTLTAFVKDLARYHGAHSVGIAELRPYHIYTHVGRGSGEYGAPITLDHRLAIAFSVEMCHELVRSAPWAPTVMESARKYVEAAKIALQMASFIRRLGHPARAHIDGNYRVIAPLVARDAGMGEIGRMGLLMTPRLGPRVRLGVVTTDAPLVPDGRGSDRSVLATCALCVKCANCCPIHAIPADDRKEIDGALRWQINADLCFRYWNATGTDCARCVSVCPYSHPDRLLHNVARWAARRAGRGRRALIWLDDLLYGSAPGVWPAPAWIPPGPRDLRRS